MFFQKTEGEKLIELIEEESPKTSQIIQHYIDTHDTSMMEEGVRYYFNQSDIRNRSIYTYENDRKVVDEDATNNKIPTSWHKTLTDQKRAYLVSKPPTIDSKIEKDPSLERINEILGDDFDDVLPELVKHATNKGKEWLHVYVNDQGEFDYMIVPAQEFIPIYDNTKRKNLIGGIRFYELDDETEKAELWDAETVTYYEKVNGTWVLDVNYEENPQAHFKYGNEGYGWSKTEGDRKKIAVPFIEFKNNEEAVSDLVFYKELIDAYETVVSDTSNTLEDVQNFIYVLKGYEGTNLDQFKTEVKKYKVISVAAGEGAGVDALRAEVPTEATEMYLNRLSEMIFQAGQGVDTTTDKFGNNPTGVALKFLYSFLDMKANTLERKFTKALKELMWFVCEYLSIAENANIEYTDYTFTFNKSMIMNEAEQAQIARDSQGLISDETLMANHPWVKDVEVEKQRKEQEIDDYSRKLPEIGEEDDDSTED